jgi:hypothetical protein
MSCMLITAWAVYPLLSELKEITSVLQMSVICQQENFSTEI